MNSYLDIKLTIGFIDSDQEPEERDRQAQQLFAELRDIDDVSSVKRVLDANPPEDNKALGGFIAGLLVAEVNVSNAKKLLAFLGDRLGGKAIELHVEANGKKLEVKAYSREELEAAIEAAQDFIST